MSEFLVFIPKAPAVNAAMLGQLGLTALLPAGYQQAGPVSGPLTPASVKGGPGESTGVLLSAKAAGMRYLPNQQSWFPHKIFGDAGQEQIDYWLGLAKDDPPTPAELVRERIVTGKVLKLADGAEWICPTAVLYDGMPKLPVRLGLDADGDDTGEVVAEYDALWQLACEVRETAIAELRDQETAAMTGDRAMEAAAECLAANYRLNLHAVKAMGLLSTENLHEILRTLVDFDGFRAMLSEFADDEKKNQPAPGD